VPDVDTTQPYVVPVPAAPPLQPGWQTGWQTGWQAMPVRPSRSGTATASLILGILGIFLFCLVLPAFLALILGLVSASTIKRSGGTLTGLGLARSGWILGLVSLLAMAAFVAAAVAGAFDTDERSVYELAVGDCVDLSAAFDVSGPDDAEDDRRIAGLPIVDCALPHDGEVYHLGDIERFDEYPGRRPVRTHVELLCTGGPFTEYVGVDYVDSEFGLYSLSPTSDAWRDGDRGYICIATGFDGESLVGSVRGSNR
jgi:hypothetical protein